MVLTEGAPVASTQLPGGPPGAQGAEQGAGQARRLLSHGPPPSSVPRICPEFLLYVRHGAGVLGVCREADRWAPAPPTPSNGGDRP